jgi:LacI family transcriptional regulator
MRERLQGFRQALAEAAIPLPDAWMATSELNIDAGRTTTHRLLTAADRPTALFVNNNLLSLGALLAIRDLGLRCPEDIALACFDDHPWAAVCAPPLTVVSQPARCIGHCAAAMLCTLIQGGTIEEPIVELSCDLIVRQSC